MDPVKKYIWITWMSLAVILLLTSIINIVFIYPLIENRIAIWVFSIMGALIVAVIMSFGFLLLLERDVEREFKKYADKYKAKVYRKKSAVIFRTKNEIITWSYSGPKHFVFYYKIKLKTNRKIDFDIKWGRIHLSSIYHDDKEIAERRKEIQVWRKELRSEGLIVNRAIQGGDQIDLWCISKIIDINKVMNVRKTIPYR
jgi:hypothetical protein